MAIPFLPKKEKEVYTTFAMRDSYPVEEPKEKKKKGIVRYIVYLSIVLIATGLSLTFSLWDQFDQVVECFKNSFSTVNGWVYMLIIAGCVTLSYLVDALIILVFCRLYTRNYKYHQAFATSLIGQFYSDVTPGSSGGQVMQTYTMKSQGIPVSSAASIMVMSFILYQTALILFDLVAFGFEFNSIMAIPGIEFDLFQWHVNIPMVPIIIFGFLLNISIILLLFLMSYSHKFHNFILHYVIGFLGKIHLLKKPDKTRENLRVQVENFKIELRRLQSNIPVVILQITLFLIMLFLRFCIPYLSGLAMGYEESFSVGRLFDASFLSAFHQMVTGIIPLPGSAGVSELFYGYLFKNFFNQNAAIISSSLILWRTSTFHIVLLISGFVSAFYKSRPKESFNYANRETFVTLQLETYDERKKSAETMYETAQLSRKAIQEKLRNTTKNIFGGKKKSQITPDKLEEFDSAFLEDQRKEEQSQRKTEQKAKPTQKKVKPKKVKKAVSKKNEEKDSWESLDI